MRKPQSAIFWQKECVFIQDVTDGVLSGLPDYRQRVLKESFNGDVQCLIRYCEMQRKFAEADGFDDSATYIQHCIDDLKGE